MNYIELKKFTLAHSKILNIDDKAKIKEQYEIIINISMQEIKKTKRKIHQEKFKMCIHKLKLSLPYHLIYQIGSYLFASVLSRTTGCIFWPPSCRFSKNIDIYIYDNKNKRPL